MNTEMRKPIQILALAAALGSGLVLAACKPASQSADGMPTAEEQAPPPAEPSPAAPSDVSGGGTTAPAADATNTAPPPDTGAPPPAGDVDKTGTEVPKPMGEAKPEEKK